VSFDALSAELTETSLSPLPLVTRSDSGDHFFIRLGWLSYMPTAPYVTFL
jgi:hypothetical protein